MKQKLSINMKVVTSRENSRYAAHTHSTPQVVEIGHFFFALQLDVCGIYVKCECILT